MKDVVRLEDCLVRKHTAKALLVQVGGVDEEIWFPISQVDLEQTDIIQEGDEGTLVISQWIADQKGVG